MVAVGQVCALDQGVAVLAFHRRRQADQQVPRLVHAHSRRAIIAPADGGWVRAGGDVIETLQVTLGAFVAQVDAWIELLVTTPA